MAWAHKGLAHMARAQTHKGVAWAHKGTVHMVRAKAHKAHGKGAGPRPRTKAPGPACA